MFRFLIFLLCGGLGAAYAQLPEEDPDAGSALAYAQAIGLALQRQPLLDGLAAEARAARQAAVAARQLPDPQLNLGVTDLPVNTGDAYSLTRDSDTQILVGVMQEFPRAAKRRLRGERIERAATRLDAEHELARRAIRRDASLAWLQLWRNDQALRLTRASLREARAQQQAVEIALRAGSSATQAEFLAASLAAGRLQDAVFGAEQSVEQARSTLSRWIGKHAFRPVRPELPGFPPLPTLETVQARVRSHPELAVAAAQVAVAQTGAELARADYQPDWRVQLGYGYRPAFSEMLMLQVGVDLPVFTRNRQDRGLAAAQAQQEAAESLVEDANRRLRSEARLNHHDVERLLIRLRDYDRHLLPQSVSRIEAALAGWRSGRGTLRDVLDARLAALELQMAHLDLQHDIARNYVHLTYLGAFETALNAGENTHE